MGPPILTGRFPNVGTIDRDLRASFACLYDAGSDASPSTNNSCTAVETAKHRLRRRLADRQREKAELEQMVRGLQARYRDEVDPMTERVLRRRVEQLKQEAQARMRSARARNAYHDAQRAYEDFQEGRTAPPVALTPDEVRTRYRRASKQCHPDAVPDAYREQAAATFQALDAAYQAGHAAAVDAIARALDEWGFPARPAVTAEEGPTIEQLSDAVSALEASIQSLRASDAYRDVQDAGTLDAAVEARKHELARRLQELQASPRDRSHRRGRRA